MPRVDASAAVLEARWAALTAGFDLGVAGLRPSDRRGSDESVDAERRLSQHIASVLLGSRRRDKVVLATREVNTKTRAAAFDLLMHLLEQAERRAE